MTNPTAYKQEGASGETRLGDEQREGNRYISVWLTSREDQAPVLQNLVTELAQDFGTYPFEPHLTIVSSFYGEPHVVDASIRDGGFTGSASQSFAFEVDDVVVGDRMTKTLYVTFKPNPEFEIYCRAFTSVPATQGTPAVPAPHLSLMYKAGGPVGFTQEQQKQLIHRAQEIKQTLQQELPVVYFDGVSLVTSNHTLTTDTDVLDYRAVQTYQV